MLVFRWNILFFKKLGLKQWEICSSIFISYCLFFRKFLLCLSVDHISAHPKKLSSKGRKITALSAICYNRVWCDYHTYVLLRCSNIKEVFCGIWLIKSNIWKFRSSLAEESHNIGEDCLSWSRRLGVTDSDEIDHLDFSRCNYSQNTVVCNALTAGISFFLSFPLVERVGKSENVSFHIARAISAGESLTMILKVKGKISAAIKE